ncbi:hypothetical protein mvi_50250 [Methylobacterium indicum]|uniref:Uncharacterized protein n=1 Tax=Methylobacterium indicum TaxID=1775910 RepID=A0A8H8WY46_9HYPH|nr:hypothetical protein mvi_50250 [Methylobacterium indicum]
MRLRKRPLTLAHRACCLHDEVQTGLSPPAGRGNARAMKEMPCAHRLPPASPMRKPVPACGAARRRNAYG